MWRSWLQCSMIALASVKLATFSGSTDRARILGRCVGVLNRIMKMATIWIGLNAMLCLLNP